MVIDIEATEHLEDNSLALLALVLPSSMSVTSKVNPVPQAQSTFPSLRSIDSLLF